MTVSTRTDNRPPADATPVGGPRSATAATFALARVEGFRLLRAPAVLVAIAVLLFRWVAPMFTGTIDRFPELYEADAELQPQLLLIGCGAMIAANLAVLRAHRHGADNFYDVVALPPWRRTLAHVLALLPLAALVGLLSVARMVQLALQPGAVGRPNPLILAAGPLLVLLLGVLGILLARLVRSALAVPLALAVVVFLMLFGLYAFLPHRLVRLSPTFTGDASSEPQLPELLGQPTVAHLCSLLGLVALLATAALLRTGAPRLPVAAVAVGAVVATVAAGGVQFAGPSAELTSRRTIAQERPSVMQRCQQRETVTYCAFPVFTARIDDWNQIVEGIQRRVPPKVAREPFVVRQRIATVRSISTNWGGTELQVDNNGLEWDSTGVRTGASMDDWRVDDRLAGTPNPISVSTTWGDKATFWSDSPEFNFAAHVAYRMIHGSNPAEVSNLVCGSAGTVLVWLAGQATPATRTAARDQLGLQVGNRTDAFRSATLGGSVDVGRREVDLGYALLDQPADRVAATLERSWTELTASETTTEQAAEIFGLTAAAPLDKVPAGEESTVGDCG